MGLNTKINYVSATHNFWYGCTKVSEGCQNCFAERQWKRFYKNYGGTKDFTKLVRRQKNFDAPLKWKKPQIILVNDMSDFFHKDVPVSWILDAFKVMREAKQHTFLLLTKRPNIANDFFHNYSCKDLENMWLGVSVENQKTADERIPELLKISIAGYKWLSIEPLLEEVTIRPYVDQFHWVVCGGETGTGARAMQAEWALQIKNQCEYESVPFFMKQMSGRLPIPKNLNIRQYPEEFKNETKT
jgi:protein gp37